MAKKKKPGYRSIILYDDPLVTKSFSVKPNYTIKNIRFYSFTKCLTIMESEFRSPTVFRRLFEEGFFLKSSFQEKQREDTLKFNNSKMLYTMEHIYLFLDFLNFRSNMYNKYNYVRARLRIRAFVDYVHEWRLLEEDIAKMIGVDDTELITESEHRKTFFDRNLEKYLFKNKDKKDPDKIIDLRDGLKL
jgi:hypothetical protein